MILFGKIKDNVERVVVGAFRLVNVVAFYLEISIGKEAEINDEIPAGGVFAHLLCELFGIGCSALFLHDLVALAVGWHVEISGVNGGNS